MQKAGRPVSNAKLQGQQRRSNKKQQNNKASNPRSQDRPQGQPRQQSAATAYATGSVGRAPVIRSGRDSTRIVHRELISSVVGSAAFAVASTFPINPGMGLTFPWLSSQASSWEEYRFNSLRFRYLTRTGTSVPGSVILAPDYDAADPAPSTEQGASSYMGVAEDAPWKDIVCHLDPKYLKRKFIRSGPLAANQDIKTYDGGNLFVATIDGTAVPWGKLWVEYDVEFFVPQVNSGAVIGGSITGGGAMTPANPLGAVPVLDTSSVGLAISAASVLTLSQTGDYVIGFQTVGTTLTDGNDIALGTSCSFLAGPGARTVVNAAGTASVASVVVRCSDLTQPTITFAVAGATVTSSGVSIAKAPLDSLL